MEINKNVEDDGVIFMSIKDKDKKEDIKVDDSVGDEDVTILAIESSCDETAAAVVRNGREVLSNIISSQIALHTVYGGVVPEIASRKHVEKMNGCIRAALSEAKLTLDDIDAVAVTYGPGLVGALLVGVSEAKAISFATGKPLIGVHHIEGHISANFIENKELKPPFMCLVVSGGHSHLVVVKDYGEYEIVGQTRDDAAGEAFDKVARAIGLGYPGGPKIDAAAKKGNPDAFTFPQAKIADAEYDFSFSGLKSAVLNYINQAKMQGQELDANDVAASFQKAVVEVLVGHAIRACKEYKINSLAIAGGVASNTALRELMEKECKANNISFYKPSPVLCTDNAAMIGAAAYYEYKKGKRFGLNLNAVPNLPLGDRERRYHAGR
ncbi:N6-L-threonylcarbamoyladenine synthase [Butyrivibrio sp. INlla21]|nr:tRNA (adenosine(37)-N6)-threonylcarbamoyltransferase complex transferase subunit TsaD [Butyrivibrio sp. INlla21]SFU87883.1 N6-L-threonylcarbamoyladenine synthase [Butyrivibrio sp. INlla21]